jgi:hypothetical protein
MKMCKKLLLLAITGLALNLGVSEASAQSRSTRASNPAAATIRSAYQNRQATMDRVNQNFSNYIRGVQQYRTPYGGRVTLPSHYSSTWGTAGGRYVQSHRAGYNPNVGSNLNWYRLQPVR